MRIHVRSRRCAKRMRSRRIHLRGTQSASGERKNRLSRDRTRAFDYFDTQNGGQKWPREVFSIRDSRPVRAVSRHLPA